jgi:hypothetical protein
MVFTGLSFRAGARGGNPEPSSGARGQAAM